MSVSTIAQDILEPIASSSLRLTTCSIDEPVGMAAVRPGAAE